MFLSKKERPLKQHHQEDTYVHLQAIMPSSASDGVQSENEAPGNCFRLLDLPPEVRNNIYYKVLENYPKGFLRSDGRGRVACRSALPRISRLVRQEFLAILYLSADTECRIVNLDFSHVVTFFNQLRDAELKALPSGLSPSDRQMILKLSIPGLLRPALLEPRLDRWLKRVQHPTKKGVNVNISYVAEPPRRGWHMGWHRWLQTRREWLTGDKQKAELEKIIEALKEF